MSIPNMHRSKIARLVDSAITGAAAGAFIGRMGGLAGSVAGAVIGASSMPVLLWFAWQHANRETGPGRGVETVSKPVKTSP